jgi:hypothetical protein
MLWQLLGYSMIPMMVMGMAGGGGCLARTEPGAAERRSPSGGIFSWLHCLVSPRHAETMSSTALLPDPDEFRKVRNEDSRDPLSQHRRTQLSSLQPASLMTKTPDDNVYEWKHCAVCGFGPGVISHSVRLGF